jgi:tRNA G18 (ribose-2'-O)-methylase SpoU
MGLSPPLDSTPSEVRALLAPIRNDFTIALHAADNAFAVGAIIRVAHSFLAREIVIIGDAPYYEKASMGMEKYENVVRLEDDAAFLAHVGARPLWAVEKDDATTSLYAVREFPRDVVLLFGSERFGIPATLVQRAQAVVGIPIYGVNHSLPLAVAAGIVMNEWARHKYASGAVVP